MEMLYQGTLTLPSCLALSECSTLNDPFTPRNRVQLNSPYKQAVPQDKAHFD